LFVCIKRCITIYLFIEYINIKGSKSQGWWTGVPQEYLVAPDIAIPSVSGYRLPGSSHQTLFGVHAVSQRPASEQQSLGGLLPVA
jgi:hypothetical protein